MKSFVKLSRIFEAMKKHTKIIRYKTPRQLSQYSTSRAHKLLLRIFTNTTLNGKATELQPVSLKIDEHVPKQNFILS